MEGDASFYYRGKYALAEGNKISGKIDVVQYSNLSNSIFGPLKSFRLILNGIMNGQAFVLSGQVEGHPTLLITIRLQKLENLIEQD
jgi:hypothetical protein